VSWRILAWCDTLKARRVDLVLQSSASSLEPILGDVTGTGGRPQEGASTPTTRGERCQERHTAAREEQSSEGRTPRADLARNRASRSGADRSVRRLRKPEGAGGWARQARPSMPLSSVGKRRRGTNPHGRKPRGYSLVGTHRLGFEVARRWLDVWVDSEEEPKPKRGVPRLFRKLAGSVGCEDLEAHPIGTKGKKGVPNQYGH
jgi:hypothetical protein